MKVKKATAGIASAHSTAVVSLWINGERGLFGRIGFLGAGIAFAFFFAPWAAHTMAQSPEACLPLVSTPPAESPLSAAEELLSNVGNQQTGGDLNIVFRSYITEDFERDLAPDERTQLQRILTEKGEGIQLAAALMDHLELWYLAGAEPNRTTPQDQLSKVPEFQLSFDPALRTFFSLKNLKAKRAFGVH